MSPLHNNDLVILIRSLIVNIAINYLHGKPNILSHILFFSNWWKSPSFFTNKLPIQLNLPKYGWICMYLDEIVFIHDVLSWRRNGLHHLESSLKVYINRGALVGMYKRMRNTLKYWGCPWVLWVHSTPTGFHKNVSYVKCMSIWWGVTKSGAPWKRGYLS